MPSEKSISRVTLWRWKSLCAAAGCEATQSDFDKVVRALRSGGRRYHTLEHLEACLREFDAARQFALVPTDVEFALWFHDAVYITWLKGNELRSAELAARTLSDCVASMPQRSGGSARQSTRRRVRQRRYGSARVAVLQSFLKRPAIYHFDFFRERYEAMARENLTRTIRQLQGGEFIAR